MILSHVDSDDSLFSLITEDTTLKFKFSQVERLLVQRLRLQETASNADKAEENQAAATASQGSSSLYSYFGFSGSTVSSDFLAATTADRKAVIKTKQYKALKSWYTEMYVLAYNNN